MTNDPQLVETIARAIADADVYPGWLDDEPGQTDIYTYLARAALSAMPQPIGYMAVMTDSAPDCPTFGTSWPDEEIYKSPDDVPRHAGSHVKLTAVVALVPVGDTHA